MVKNPLQRISILSRSSLFWKKPFMNALFICNEGTWAILVLRELLAVRFVSEDYMKTHRVEKYLESEI